MYSLVQLFTFGLAALTAGSGSQVSTAGNAGLSRYVAGQALIAFAVPALAIPLDNAGLFSRNATLPADDDCDDGDEGSDEDEGDSQDEDSEDEDSEDEDSEDEDSEDEDSEDEDSEDEDSEDEDSEDEE